MAGIPSGSTLRNVKVTGRQTLFSAGKPPPNELIIEKLSEDSVVELGPVYRGSGVTVIPFDPNASTVHSMSAQVVAEEKTEGTKWNHAVGPKETEVIPPPVHSESIRFNPTVQVQKNEQDGTLQSVVWRIPASSETVRIETMEVNCKGEPIVKYTVEK